MREGVVVIQTRKSSTKSRSIRQDIQSNEIVKLKRELVKRERVRGED